MKKRLLSVLLLVCMVLTLLPTAALAEDVQEEDHAHVPVCICETACTEGAMNGTCPVCGAEDAQPEACALYAGEPAADDPDLEEEDDEAPEEIEEIEEPEDDEASVLAPQLAEDGIAVQAAHTHCYCGGSVTAGDHTSHSAVTYTAWNGTSSISYTNNTAYVYLTGNVDQSDPLFVQDGQTLYLCLNGYSLRGKGITCYGGSTLYLCDCSSPQTGTVSDIPSSCISVSENAALYMYSGTLCNGNTANSGGGVNVKGTMNLYGGTIRDNTAASDGGGIFVNPTGTLNLYGGTITGNKVNTVQSTHGGGVYVGNSKSTNTAGKIYISGSPVITGNTQEYTDASTNVKTTTTENLYLSHLRGGPMPIIELGSLTPGAEIGISAKRAAAFSTASETDYSKYFFSDDTGCHVEYNTDKKLELKSGAAHVHSGGTATCTEQAVCSECHTPYGSIDPNNHTGSLGGWKCDSTEHWKEYSCCKAKAEKSAHSGGTADCTHKAVCTVCGGAYGDLASHNFTAETVDAKYLKSAADCENAAVYYKSCTGCGLTSAGTSDEATFESGNSLGHDWGEPEYTWTPVPDGYMCAAKKVCQRCSTDVSEVATVTYAVTKAPTCLNEGTGTYTATFSAAFGFPTQTNTVTIPATGHRWGQVTYNWVETETTLVFTCTAKRVCENDSTHEETEIVTAVYYSDREPTCLETGHGTYAASFENDWAGLSQLDVTLPALGHDFAAWTSKGDGTHTRVCANDVSHTETGDCTGGTATCTAKAVCETCGGAYGAKDPDNHTGRLAWDITETHHEQAWTCCGRVTVAKAAHTFGDWVVTKRPTSREEGEKARTCSVCGHTETKTLPKTGGGPTYYTLVFESNGGSKIANVNERHGTVVDLTLAKYQPTRSGYDFTGWYSDKELTKRVTSVKLYENMTVYAGWSAWELPFTDVARGDWFFDDVRYVYETGLMNGVTATRFAPYGSTTRGMIVTILYRMEGQPSVSRDCPFTDVSSGSYYARAITWAAANGIVTGHSSTIFAPDAAITREQLAAILYRYAGYKGLDVSVGENTNILSYEDFASLSEYAIPAMQWACGAGVLYGFGGSLLPDAPANRLQAAAILHRFCVNILN